MCQLFALSASTQVSVGFDWQHFVIRGAGVYGNPDGWGVAFQEGRDYNLIREPHTAEKSPCVRFFAAHGPASCQVVSHVRRATIGDQILANTQPFVRKMGGRSHLFAHNGHVPPNPARDEVWLKPVGETDSEILFLDLLHRLEILWQGDDIPSLDDRTAIVADFAGEARERGAVNFLYSDGVTLFAHGHRRTIPGGEVSTDPGLYLYQQELAHSEFPDLCEGLTCQGSAQVTMIATVPLSEGPWRPLAAGEMLRIEKGALV